MYKGPKTTMYIVRSLNMVNWLCSHGFKILKVEDSEKDEKLKVFFFEESPALHHTMMMYRKAPYSCFKGYILRSCKIKNQESIGKQRI